jgi:hypothetical protein
LPLPGRRRRSASPRARCPRPRTDCETTLSSCSNLRPGRTHARSSVIRREYRCRTAANKPPIVSRPTNAGHARRIAAGKCPLRGRSENHSGRRFQTSPTDRPNQPGREGLKPLKPTKKQHPASGDRGKDAKTDASPPRFTPAGLVAQMAEIA